jgi:hypothetical protein
MKKARLLKSSVKQQQNNFGSNINPLIKKKEDPINKPQSNEVKKVQSNEIKNEPINKIQSNEVKSEPVKENVIEKKVQSNTKTLVVSDSEEPVEEDIKKKKKVRKVVKVEKDAE